jgi:hypothetical protein
MEVKTESVNRDSVEAGAMNSDVTQGIRDNVEGPKEVIDAAEFLQYQGTEEEIVERILMNLHPEILAQATLLPRPNSYRELRNIVGLIEERMAVSRERQRSGAGYSTQKFENSSQGRDRQRASTGTSQQASRGPKCWNCNRWGHLQKNCNVGNSSGNVAVISAVGGQSMNQVDQNQQVKLRSDQITGNDKHNNVILSSQHKCEVVKSKMTVETVTGSEHNSEGMGSLVNKKGPRCPRKQKC